MSAKLSAADVIRLLDLKPLGGEGGFYRETYISTEQLAPGSLPPRYSEPKPLYTAIYFLLTPDSFSALHRLPTDEVYHFYLGDPAELLQLNPDGSAQRLRLGPDLAAGQHLQWLVPGGAWQGSHVAPGGDWSLLGTTMAPGFTNRDLELGSRAELTAQYPAEAELIRQLTRGPFA